MRLGLVLADARLCPAIKSVGVCGYALQGGFIDTLKGRFGSLKTLGTCWRGPHTPVGGVGEAAGAAGRTVFGGGHILMGGIEEDL